MKRRDEKTSFGARGVGFVSLLTLLVGGCFYVWDDRDPPATASSASSSSATSSGASTTSSSQTNSGGAGGDASSSTAEGSGGFGGHGGEPLPGNGGGGAGGGDCSASEFLCDAFCCNRADEYCERDFEGVGTCLQIPSSCTTGPDLCPCILSDGATCGGVNPGCNGCAQIPTASEQYVVQCTNQAC